jgi:hypothetical protein
LPATKSRSCQTDVREHAVPRTRLGPRRLPFVMRFGAKQWYRYPASFSWSKPDLSRCIMPSVARAPHIMPPSVTGCRAAYQTDKCLLIALTHGPEQDDDLASTVRRWASHLRPPSFPAPSARSTDRSASVTFTEAATARTGTRAVLSRASSPLEPSRGCFVDLILDSSSSARPSTDLGRVSTPRRSSSSRSSGSPVHRSNNDATLCPRHAGTPLEFFDSQAQFGAPKFLCRQCIEGLGTLQLLRSVTPVVEAAASAKTNQRERVASLQHMVTEVRTAVDALDEKIDEICSCRRLLHRVVGAECRTCTDTIRYVASTVLLPSYLHDPFGDVATDYGPGSLTAGDEVRNDLSRCSKDEVFSLTIDDSSPSYVAWLTEVSNCLGRAEQCLLLEARFSERQVEALDTMVRAAEAGDSTSDNFRRRTALHLLIEHERLAASSSSSQVAAALHRAKSDILAHQTRASGACRAHRRALALLRQHASHQHHHPDDLPAQPAGGRPPAISKLRLDAVRRATEPLSGSAKSSSRPSSPGRVPHPPFSTAAGARFPPPVSGNIEGPRSMSTTSATSHRVSKESSPARATMFPHRQPWR